MPLEDATTSREPNGAFNEEYCKWCYAGGEFRYTSKEQLIDFAWSIWQMKTGRRNRFVRIWKQLYRI